MKKKRLISLALILVMLVSLLPLAAAPAFAAPAPSPWAVPEMNEANVQGLLTPSAARNYQKNLTRDEFCEIVVKLVETVKGESLPLPATNPFTDTNSIYILKAFSYGITNGTTPTTFSPNESVTRQQIATMMYRAIAGEEGGAKGLEKELGRTLLSPPAATLPFVDAAGIADYAVTPIRYAYANGIILGDELGRVLPKGNITAEQCVAIAIRSFKQMESVLSQYRTAAQNLDFTEKRLTIGYAFGDTAYGVTQNIVLPTSGSGGAVITWTSSDNSVISIGSVLYDSEGVTPIGRVGVVTVGGSAQNVTLTATITLGGQTRTQTFTLRTSTLYGDALLYENAYNLLNIMYLTEGDSATSVSGRIGLPNKVLDLPVTWSSNNPSVVTNTGLVYPPTGSEVRYATLTATIGSGTLSRTKIFELTIVNASTSRGVSLNGVELGSTPTRVTQVLGTVAKTIAASTTESWQLYYSSNYANFIAVGFVNNRAVAVFSMASTVANQLKNAAGAVITVDQANAVSGVNAISYSDGTQQYAVMIYETSSTIGSQRSLTVDKQEELLFELVNAYRARNSRSALELSTKLGTIARAHSAGNIGSAPSLGTGTNALSYKAEAIGFYTTGNQPRYTGGNILSGQNDAFGFLRELINNATMRGEILDSTSTVFGAGFAASTTGTGSYGNYMTYILGSVKFITGVTTTAATGTPATIRIGGTGSGSSLPITLAITYTSLISSNDYVESFTVTSSNQNIFTVAYATGTTCTITGVAAGDANLVITGNLSGKVIEIPVNVGAVYATALQVTYPGITGTSLNDTPLMTLAQTTTVTSASYPNESYFTLVIGSGESLTLSATASAALGTTPAVTWARSGATTQTSNTYTFAPTSAGYLTVSVQTSSGTSITHRINYVVVSPPTITPSSASSIIVGGTVNLTAGPPPGLSIPAPTGYSWASGNSAVLSRTTAQTNNPATFTGAGTGGVTTAIATAIWNTSTYIGKASGQVSVTVSGSPYATGFSLVPASPIYLLLGGPMPTLTAAPTPMSVVPPYSYITSWTPSNAAVVDVNSTTGTLIAVATGTATITATMAKSAAEQYGLSSFVTVTVITPTITISPSSLSLINGVSLPQPLSHTLATMMPYGVAVKWSSDNTAVATVDDDGVLTAVSPGTANITATVTLADGSPLAVPFSDTITVTVTP